MIAITDNGYGDTFTPPTSGGTFAGIDRFGNAIYTPKIQPRTATAVTSPSVVPAIGASLGTAKAPTPSTSTASTTPSTSTGTTAVSSSLPAGYSTDANGNVYAPTQYGSASGSGSSGSGSSGSGSSGSGSDLNASLLGAIGSLFQSQAPSQNLAPVVLGDPNASAAPADAGSSNAGSRRLFALLALVAIGAAVWYFKTHGS